MTWPALYLDTETADWHEPNGSMKALPVQIALIFALETRVISTLSCVISQRHWEGIKLNPIAERAIAKHGITPEICDAYGVPPDVVINYMRRVLKDTRIVIAHNIRFDLSVIDYMLDRQQVPPFDWPEEFCTMRESATILGIHSGGWNSINGFKAPKLAEAFRKFAGRDLVNNHDALADTYACRLIHRGVLKHRASSDRPEGVE